ncbi:MAG TPA: alpha/beta hydrolase, partial [Egicoccus sp.]
SHGTGAATLERPTTQVGEPPGVLARVWRDRRLALLVVVTVVAAAALVAGWLTPRGPLTPQQVIVTTLAMLAVGALAGLVLGSRWSLLLAPVVFVAVFELARLGTAGATVDGIHLTSTYGLFAFVAGRVAHGLMVLPALVVGAAHGVWSARRLGHPTAPAPGIPAVVFIVLGTIGVAALAVALVLPGTTPPILGPDGRPVEGSIAELATVEIGGVEQVILLRGRDVDSPVLLHLAGGPGGTDLGAMRADTDLETDFVVATWEQRGTGKSYATSIDPVEQLTLEQAVSDTLEVVDHLRERFGEDRVYLSANSWGTIPGVLAVQRSPESFHAYVGTGQMVNNRLTDQMFHEDALAWAEETGNDALAQRIREAGPPPYDDLLDYEYTVSYEHQWNAYPGVDELWEMPFNTFVAENSLLDRINALRGMFDVNYFVYPQLQDHDFRRDAPRLDVPVYLVLGQYEARGRAVLADEWFDLLDAPSKQRIVFEDSGHRPSFEQPADFADLLRDVAATTGNAQRP